jgi:hypothetical protein
VLERPGPLFGGAVAAVLGAGLFYLLALVGSDLLTLQSSDELCDRGPYRFLNERLVPLSAECIYRDGTREQLVSPLVNPILALLLLTALLLLVLGLRALFVRPGRRSPSGGPRDESI